MPSRLSLCLHPAHRRQEPPRLSRGSCRRPLLQKLTLSCVRILQFINGYSKYTSGRLDDTSGGATVPGRTPRSLSPLCPCPALAAGLAAQPQSPLPRKMAMAWSSSCTHVHPSTVLSRMTHDFELGCCLRSSARRVLRAAGCRLRSHR